MSRQPERFRTGGVSLRRRVGVAFLTVAALGIIALTFTALTFNGLLDARVRLIDRLDPAVLASRDLRSALLNQESGARGYALAAEEQFLEPYTRGRADEAAAVKHLQAAIGNDPALTTALNDTLHRAAEWRQTSAEPLIATVRASGARAATQALLQESENRFDAFRLASATLEQALDAERADANRRLDKATRVLVQVAAAGLVAGAVGGLVLWRALARWVLRPLDSLGDQTRRVTAGEFDRPIEPVGPPEIMRVAGDTDAMRRRIRAELAAMEDAREQLEELVTFYEAMESSSEEVTQLQGVEGAVNEAAPRAREMGGEAAEQAQDGAGQGTYQAQETAKRASEEAQGAAQGTAEQARDAAGEATEQEAQGLGGSESQSGVGEDEDRHATRAAEGTAEKLGVDLSEVEGSGAGGRITLTDVIQAAQG